MKEEPMCVSICWPWCEVGCSKVNPWVMENRIPLPPQSTEENKASCNDLGIMKASLISMIFACFHAINLLFQSTRRDKKG